MNKEEIDKGLKELQIVIDKLETTVNEQQTNLDTAFAIDKNLSNGLITNERDENKMENNLVFDLGFHRGEDTKHYLSKGCKVVAVEANPFLVEQAKIDFKKEIEKGDLVLLNRAVGYGRISGDPKVTGTLEFFVNSKNTDWSSCIKEYSEQQNNISTKVVIDAILPEDLINKFGIPYFIKVDVEGNDTAVLENLYSMKNRGYPKKIVPKYISLELNKKDYKYIFAYLLLLGYTEFQLINQVHNDPYTSGKFGEFLDKDKWIDYDEALSRYIKFRELRILDGKNLSGGWLDVVGRL